MIEYLAEERTGASAERIWNLWSNVSEWNTWDNDVKSSVIFGNFEHGVDGILYPKKGPKSKFILTEVVQNKKFITTSKLPLTELNFIHEISDLGKERIITHKIQVTGIFSKLFNTLFVKDLSKGLSKTISSLIVLAENEEF